MAKNWRTYGDVTYQQWKDTITEAGGPTGLAARAIYDALKGYTALALSMLGQESSYFTRWNANVKTNLNPWNLRPPSGNGYVKYSSFLEAARAWRTRLIEDKDYKDGVYQETISLADLIHVYAPDNDGNDEQEYVDSVLSRLQSWGVDSSGSTVVSIGSRPLHIAIGAGHRHTLGDQGNPYEAQKNGEKVNAVLNLLDNSSGIEYRCYTPGRGLGLYPGYLNQAAAQAVVYDESGWTVDVFVECHSEGVDDPSVRGLFVIYPDSAPDVDVDVREFGNELATIVARRCGFTLRQGGVVEPGVMSEKQTGVGSQGYRLGVFRDTASLIDHSSRFIIEAGAHSNPQDHAIMESPAFLGNHAFGLIEGIAALAKTRMGWTGAYRIGPGSDPGEEPEEPPTDPEPPVDEIVLPKGLTWAAVKRLYNPLHVVHPVSGSLVVFDQKLNHRAMKAWLKESIATTQGKDYSSGTFSPLVVVIRRGDGSFIYQHANGRMYPSGK